MKIKSKILGISTTLLVAFAILLVSVLKSATVTHTYSPVVLSDKVVANKTISVDYLLAYPGKIGPDSPLWYPKVIRDRLWYMFTFNKSKKTELNLLFADKRLNSALVLFQKNKPDLGFSTLSKAEKYLELAVPNMTSLPIQSDEPEYLKKLATASLKHKEVIENEILPIAPEDLRPKVIIVGNHTTEVYKKVRDLMLTKGLVPPQNPFELK